MEVKHPLLLEVYQQCRVQIFDTVFALERLPYDLEKVFAICFTDQCLARLKHPTKETSNVDSKQFDCLITLLHFK